MMESPPQKRQKTNNYNLYTKPNHCTENPNINYLSPPRKKNKINNFNSAPHNYPYKHKHTHHNLSSSPISTRYQTRIGTSLYHHDNNHNHNDQAQYSSPIRTRTSEKRKHLSPISPTFKSILHSPAKHRNNDNNIDRYTPNRGNMNRYNLHSSTQRFIHNNENMMNHINLIRASPSKKRKLGQNYSNTNDDPNSLNHKLKEKLSQHTYNMVLQCELLGVSHQYNHMNTSQQSPQNMPLDNDDNEEFEQLPDDNDEPHIYGSPSLPNRRIIHDITPQKQNKKNKNQDRNDKNASHHPLCPCYNNNDDEDIFSEDESEILNNNNNNNNNDEYVCECDAITSNIATNFLASPQRTLRYKSYNNEDEENNTQKEKENYAMTPLKQYSQSQLSRSIKSIRNIAKSPFKVLDAPRLTDDFYLNLVDWSSTCNILSVGLGECVYLWSAHTSQVTKLVDLTALFSDNFAEFMDMEDGCDMVCSVGWSKKYCGGHNGDNDHKRSDLLAVGSGAGYLFIFDTVKSALYTSAMTSSAGRHAHRISSISWRDNNILCTGSRDRNIFLRDIRIPTCDIVSKLLFHKQEVCGLEWSHDSLYLASGGNDNKLVIWDMRHVNKPLCSGKHKAAVKAITWSPHQSGLIASGGGTADRCIKFWNISSGNNSTNNGLKSIESIDTGSQVCNLLWSKNVNEIVSTHGYSLNQIVVWKYPSMDKIVTLTGHTYRVLYLAASPDGQTIVTGAGDETLRLWNIFPPKSNHINQTFVPQTYSIPLHIR